MHGCNLHCVSLTMSVFLHRSFQKVQFVSDAQRRSSVFEVPLAILPFSNTIVQCQLPLNVHILLLLLFGIWRYILKLEFSMRPIEMLASVSFSFSER